MSNEQTPPPQHSPDDAGTNGEPSPKQPPLENNVKSRSTWLRLVFMIIVGVLYAVARVVTVAVVVLQFLWVLFTGKTNKKLLNLGASLATYAYQVIRYLTYNTDERPFPFDADWPT